MGGDGVGELNGQSSDISMVDLAILESALLFQARLTCITYDIFVKTYI